VSLLVQLQMVEHLKYCLHQLILCGYVLLYLWVVVGIVGLIVASLTIALSVPRVHHLRDFLRKGYKFSNIGSKPQLYAVIFIKLD
jgi:hypothetical protein